MGEVYCFGQKIGLPRWCDDSCKRATVAQCFCICHGRYHGMGKVAGKIKYIEDKTGQLDLFKETSE